MTFINCSFSSRLIFVWPSSRKRSDESTKSLRSSVPFLARYLISETNKKLMTFSILKPQKLKEKTIKRFVFIGKILSFPVSYVGS